MHLPPNGPAEFPGPDSAGPAKPSLTYVCHSVIAQEWPVVRSPAPQATGQRKEVPVVYSELVTASAVSLISGYNTAPIVLVGSGNLFRGGVHTITPLSIMISGNHDSMAGPDQCNHRVPIPESKVS